LQKTALHRVPAGSIIDDAEDVATAQRHDERQALGERQEPALPELCVHQIVSSALEARAKARPRASVVGELLIALEVEHVKLHTAGTKKIGLALDEVCRARLPVNRVVACDHQHA
jgi:hypothetical protein